eukprot:UN19825
MVKIEFVPSISERKRDSQEKPWQIAFDKDATKLTNWGQHQNFVGRSKRVTKRRFTLKKPVRIRKRTKKSKQEP